MGLSTVSFLGVPQGPKSVTLELTSLAFKGAAQRSHEVNHLTELNNPAAAS